MARPDMEKEGVETRFQSGHSGNPAGRPKGSKNIKTQLIELLSSQDPDGEWTKPTAMQLIKKAFRDNDLSALREIIDRVEGKLVQKNEHTGEIMTERLIIIKETNGNQTKEVSGRLSIQPSEVPGAGSGSGDGQDDDAPGQDS